MKADRLRQLARERELPLVPALPVAELAGDRRVLIEHHRKITCCTRELIRVEMEYGSLCIHGRDLVLQQLDRVQLVIGGCVDALTIERADECRK